MRRNVCQINNVIDLLPYHPANGAWECDYTGIHKHASVRLFIYKRISKKGRQYYLSYTKSV
eukprot:scaffold187_cov266-Chaetoceros_neogracile.AAC.52